MFLNNFFELIHSFVNKIPYKRKSMKPNELFTSISQYLISEGEKIFGDCDRHIVETVTLSKYVTEHEQMWTRMDEFLSKFQCSGISGHYTQG